MPPDDDPYAQAMVDAIRDMGQRLVEYRQEAMRAVYSIHQDFTRRAEQDARERAERQREIDARFDRQDHDRKRGQRINRWLHGATLAIILSIAIYLILR